MRKKQEMRDNVAQILQSLSNKEITEKTKQIENQLFGFANFLESKIVLLYMNGIGEVKTKDIIKKCFDYNKIVILPAFKVKRRKMILMKIDNIDNKLKHGQRGVLEPSPAKCKTAPIKSLDIAIIPGIAFDEKGGRIGTGRGYYDRFIPKLPDTTRKVALAFECQIIPQAPVKSHDRHVDIVITEERIIYKI